MRKQRIWLMVALGIGFIVSGAGRAQDVVNLLANGGFEAA